MRKRIRLERVSGFKYVGCILNESGTDEAEWSGRRVAGAIRSLVNAMSLQLSVLGSCTSHCWCLFLRMVVRQ